MTSKIKYLVFVLTFASLFLACKKETKEFKETQEATIDSLLSVRFKHLLKHPVDSLSFPRSYSLEKKEINKVPSKDWTSGFYPGNLWLLYQLTGDERFKEQAIKWTALIEKEKYNDQTHDMGFKVYCSFGQGNNVQPNQSYDDIIVESAKTLSTRFNKNVGSLRSWDFNKDIWEFPVIIDNMMNLELLFEATKISGDSTYHDIAVSHATTTLKNHFRDDHSSYHVVVYDTITGKAKDKVTHQGFDANSAWARGQAWAIYGYTMTYRYTKNPKFLQQAIATFDFYLNNPSLRDDGIPYWDFNDPEIPNAVRDVSAATIIASACYELHTYTDSPMYKSYANKVLNTLKSKEYILEKSINAPFILKHSTGNWPKNDEMDEPIVYGDYYFLEALLRQQKI
ncbi:glycoside hydrolase family 88 protein [Flavobacterium sp. ASW18X]|uniref:glycoside hydrolase family 88 protein n=1 Tax=Flavobacterium sp. ASW18X TaxID=2572595 RepID=UPI0010AE59EA|nr:glycoside hydrolase family 88 protein [Flavobacterium sp. ASW18X]TKD63363.1 glucuronyl hydrolase [Flavobacterium sp. ASW18X]